MQAKTPAQGSAPSPVDVTIVCAAPVYRGANSLAAPSRQRQRQVSTRAPSEASCDGSHANFGERTSRHLSSQCRAHMFKLWRQQPLASGAFSRKVDLHASSYAKIRIPSPFRQQQQWARNHGSSAHVPDLGSCHALLFNFPVSLIDVLLVASFVSRSLIL
jgi:hypothetical protein